MKKKFVKYVSFAVILGMMLTGCGKQPITDSNSRPYAETNFDVKIYNTYIDDPNDDYDNLFASKELKTVAVMEFSQSHATLDAVADYYCKNYIPDEYKAEKEEVVLPNDLDSIKLSYSYESDGALYYSETFFVESEGCVLVLAGASLEANKDSLSYEIEQMAGTVEYTSTYTLPDTYPYVEKYESVSVSVNEGFVSRVIDGDIRVMYRETDNVDRGTYTKFVLGKQDKEIAENASEFANKRFEYMVEGSGYDNIEAMELKLGELGEVPAELKDVQVCGVHGLSTTANLMMEFYYFDYNGDTYAITITYLDGDETAKADMFGQLKNIEIK